MAGVAAFRREFNSSDVANPKDYESADARRLRYALYWAMYENTAYENVHKWAIDYRKHYGLYKFVRSIYNPAYRLGEFWASHLMGGLLDPDAGDGSEKQSALPLLIPDTNGKAEPLRAAIGNLWRASNWQIFKDNYARYGAIMGDTALKVIDDAERGRVYLDVINPSQVTDLVMDRYGNCKGYRLDYPVEDPDKAGQMCVYGEVAERLPGTDEVQYSTYKDDKPYSWGAEWQWSIPYGFVPLVFVQHKNMGLRYGWSEFHPSQSKMREADDIASSLSDHIRKSVNTVWLFAGVDNPAKSTGKKTIPGAAAATSDNPMPSREETPALYGPTGATAEPLVAPLNYEGVLAHLQGVVDQIEKDYPELRFDNMRVSGDASGKALRIARQPVEAKVKATRANYDDGLKRAQQMAVAIGGWRGYEGYQGFDLASYRRGELDHAIGDRDVFPQDELEKLEQDTAFWLAAQAATTAGVSLEGYLRDQQWDDERIQKMLYTNVVEQ
jgi:hypothetical protein